MGDAPKYPEQSETTLGNEPTSAWETVAPPPAQAGTPMHATPVLLPPPSSAVPTPPAAGAGGYQQVYDGAAPASGNYGQGYSGGAQGYPTGGANMPPNAPPNYTPPGGYAGQQPPPAGQQGYYPPQGQYNSPNVADMLAAGVLFGRGRRWQRRPRRLVFWPIMISLIVFVSMLHGCMHLFSW